MKDIDELKNSTALSLLIEGLESDTEMEPSLFNIDIYLDKTLQYTASFGTTITLVLPPELEESNLMLIVRSATPQPETRPMGSIAFKLSEFGALDKNKEHKHWVTLFDDEDDNLYDGDYEENDEDFPRILISYKLIQDNSIIQNIENEPQKEKNEIDQKQVPIPKKEIRKIPIGREEARGGISFGPNFAGREETSENKKDEEVIIKTPTKPEEIMKQESVVQQDSNSPKVEQNLFTLSEHGKNKDNETPTKGMNPLLFSRQAIIKDAEAEKEDYLNKGSTVEFNNESPEQKHESPIQEPPIKGLDQPENEPDQKDASPSPVAEEDHKVSPGKVPGETSPRFGASAEKQLKGVLKMPKEEKKGETTTNMQNEPKIEENIDILDEDTDQKTKQIEADIIEKQNERVQKLKQELHDCELEKSALLEKHQKEIQQFDIEYANWVKEKNEMKNKIVSLEYELNLQQETANQKTQELTQFKEFYENERALKEQEYSLKIEQLEAKIKTQDPKNGEQPKNTAEIDAMYKKLHEELEAISKNYEEKCKVLHSNLVESQAKVTDYLAKLQESEIREHELNETVSRQQIELESNKKELDKVRLEHENCIKTIAGLEQKISDASKNYALKISELTQENLDYQSKYENLKLEFDKIKSECSQRISEVQKDATQINDLTSTFREEAATYLKKSQKLSSELETQKNKYDAIMEEKLAEIELLREKNKSLEQEYLKHEKLLEDGNRKDATIKNLESLIEDYKAENARLLKQLFGNDEQMLENRGKKPNIIPETQARLPKGAYMGQGVQSTTKKYSKKDRDDYSEITELRENYDKLLQQYEDLNSLLHPKTEENETLKRTLTKYKLEIAELKEQLLSQSQPATKNKSPLKSSVSKNVPSVLPQSNIGSAGMQNAQQLDKVDQAFVQHMNKAKCPVVLRKLGQGEYIFGTRKIFAKIHNGKLVVRVGGGYLLIDEFLRIYTSHEIGKLEKTQFYEENEEDSYAMDPKNRIFVRITYKKIETATGIVQEPEFYYEIPQGKNGKVQFRSPQRRDPMNNNQIGIESARLGINMQKVGEFKQPSGATTDRTKKKLSFGLKKIY